MALTLGHQPPRFCKDSTTLSLELLLQGQDVGAIEQALLQKGGQGRALTLQGREALVGNVVDDIAVDAHCLEKRRDAAAIITFCAQ